MSTSIICTRSFTFAVDILRICEGLATRSLGARHIAHQLARCGTSIGSNAEESQEAQTKREFIAKLSISRKEARETIYWIRLALASGAAKLAEIEKPLDEAKQLLAMIRSAIKTAQSGPSRSAPQP
jgi:four helix bundle protein